MVRCKMKCEKNVNGSISLTPIIDGSEENKQFFRYTPSGICSFYTINESAAKEFTVGREYYIDISLAE